MPKIGLSRPAHPCLRVRRRRRSCRTPTAAEKLGFQYFYDEAGSLLFEQGTGGAQSTGRTFYVHLPTPSGPMPIAVYLDAKHYAVHTDHLNTPRRLTNSSKQPAWQWAFSAFGDEAPTKASNRFVDPATTPNAGTTTIADVTFNLRYPGQYFDKESGLSYNWMRSYRAQDGRYTRADPMDLAGGWNKYNYVEGNPLGSIDPTGLLNSQVQGWLDRNRRDTSNCATPECVAGLQPTTSDNRTQTKIDQDICELTCGIAAPDNVLPGGWALKKLGRWASEKAVAQGFCKWLCKPDDKKQCEK
jgi:RHS repeat-associated protein